MRYGDPMLLCTRRQSRFVSECVLSEVGHAVIEREMSTSAEVSSIWGGWQTQIREPQGNVFCLCSLFPKLCLLQVVVIVR